MTQTQPGRITDDVRLADDGGEVRQRTYSWADPRFVASHIGGKSGIEVLRSMISGDVPGPPIMATLDFDRLEVPREGSVQVFLTPKEFHYNPLGSVHGGVISALVDTAAGCAVHTTLPPGMGYTSLDLHTRFLRPVTLASGQLRCEGSVTSKTRQTALAEAHLYDAAGRLVAHATSTCMLFPLPA
jgi:uncharacterized protein (TIGR00369 family)